MLLKTSIFRNILYASIFILSTQSLFADCQYKQNIKGESLAIGVILNWSTSSEKENAMFIIERSNDGLIFTNIGAVKGAGHSTDQKNYSFLDKTKSKRQRYYRLRQVDNNGTFSTSSVFIYNNKPITKASMEVISPTAIGGQLEIQFESPQEGNFDFELLNEQGQSLSTKKIKANKGSNTYLVDVGTYSNSIFQLKLISLGQEQTITFRKKHRDRGVANQ